MYILFFLEDVHFSANVLRFHSESFLMDFYFIPCPPWSPPCMTPLQLDTRPFTRPLGLYVVVSVEYLVCDDDLSDAIYLLFLSCYTYFLYLS